MIPQLGRMDMECATVWTVTTMTLVQGPILYDITCAAYSGVIILWILWYGMAWHGIGMAWTGYLGKLDT